MRQLFDMVKAHGLWAQGYVAQVLLMIQRVATGKGKIEDFLPPEARRKERVSSKAEIDQFLSFYPESKPPTPNG